MGIGNKSKCVINLKGENNNHDKQENYNNLFFKITLTVFGDQRKMYHMI